MATLPQTPDLFEQARSLGIAISPATTTLGAEIAGLDLDRPLTDAEAELLHAAWLRFKVVFFRDQDISQQTEILGRAFDDVLLYQDQCQRGRADGEVIALLRAGLQGATRTSHVEEINGEFVAIDRALDRLEEGDLCLILIDQVDAALAHITRRGTQAKAA